MTSFDDTAKKDSSRSTHIGNELFLYSEGRRARACDFENGCNVILIHAFTANSNYMRTLAKELDAHGYNAFIYNYQSYKGIKKAAEILSEMLESFNKINNDAIARNKISFICHSMGGLVARALYQLTESSRFVLSIVTLGTPHCGTLLDSKLVSYAVKWGENVSRAMPGFNPSCQSALELVGKDTDSESPLLKRLKNESSTLGNIPILSISGGKKWLEVGDSDFANYFANRFLQNNFGRKPNDGLVLEDSSNLAVAVEFSGENINHVGDYKEYSSINHTYIIHNQTISLKIIEWLKSKCE